MAVEGRLDWREWEAKDGRGKRQKVEIIANSVQFLGGKPNDGDTAGATDSLDEDRQHAGVGAGGEEDDIPF